MKLAQHYHCTLAAAAMVFDEHPLDLIKDIGHDGMEVIFPELPPPGCYKGFHMQEIIDVGLDLGFTLTLIEVWPVQTATGNEEYILQTCGGYRDLESRFKHRMMQGRGILLGSGGKYWHACAFEGCTVFDPKGKIYHIDDCEIKIQLLYLVHKIKSKPENNP